MRKSQTTAFLSLLFYIGKLIFCQKTYLKKLSLYCYIRIVVFTWQVIGNAVAPTPIQIFIDFVCATLRSKIIGKRLGILTYRKYKERDRNISKTFVFIFHDSMQHEASGYTLYKEKQAFAREYFWFKQIHVQSQPQIKVLVFLWLSLNIFHSLFQCF